MKLIITVTILLLAIVFTSYAAKQKVKKTVTATEEETVVKDGNVEKTYKITKEEKQNKDLEWHVKRCPSGWYRYHNEKCYKFFPDQLNQAEAELACQSVGSTLASLSSDQERQFIKSLVLKETEDETLLDNLWIGLRRKVGIEYNFDLSPVVGSVARVSSGQPEEGAFNCASLACDVATATNATGDFCAVQFIDCSDRHTYACQKTIIDYYRSSSCMKEI